MKFGEIVKELRQEQGLTHKQLAQSLNCSSSIISDWENEKKQPTLDSLIKLSQFFAVTIDYLAGLEN